MSVKISTQWCDSVFSYSGEDLDLWLKAVERACKLYALVNNGKTYKARVDVNNTTYFLKSLKAVKDCIKDPGFCVIVERMLSHVKAGTWEELEREFSRDEWKKGLRHVWKSARVEGLLENEARVYEALASNVGGVSVGYITEWLLEHGFYARYVDVKTSLSHLLRLCVVEYQGNMWSTRYGVLEVEC